MLNAIERKLTAILGDGLAARAHVRVVEGDGAPLGAGQDVVQVSVSDLAPADSFDRDQFAIGPPPPALPATVRRVLPIRFGARVAFAMRPGDESPAALVSARGLLLDDVSLAAHLLADPSIRDGGAFLTNDADPGFALQCFALDQGTIPAGPDGAGGPLRAELSYRGEATIWPPGPAGEQGIIAAVEPLTVALPIEAKADDASVQAGSGTRVRVRGVSGSRLIDPATGDRSAVRLAVAVVSDLPPDRRGSISSGEPGADAGFRIVPAGGSETVIDYSAPAGDLGATRVEYVAIHLATPAGRAGAFLGSAAVHLVPRPGP